MDLKKRFASRAFAVLVLLGAVYASNSFADYPDKPIKLIVPFPPGGPTDAMARLVGQSWGVTLGQPIIVDNKGGAGGVLATEAAAGASPDGYTLFFATTGTTAINPYLYPNMKVDPLKAFDSVGLIATTSNVLVVMPNFPANNVAELISLAKAKPGTITYGSAGNGSSNHLSGELLKSMAGIDIVHIPYKGSSAALTDLMGGQISMMFDTVSIQSQNIQAGKLKALGVTGLSKSNSIPKVPTISESGLPGYEVSIWFGVLAPKGTPAAILQKLNSDLNKTLSQPEMLAKLSALGADPKYGTPQEFWTQIQKDSAKWSRVVKSSGAKID